jgi:hypothetical protein
MMKGYLAGGISESGAKELALATAFYLGTLYSLSPNIIMTYSFLFLQINAKV